MMMEEVTSDEHHETETSDVGPEAGIADQLQDAATTNVTQGSRSRQSSPPVSVESPLTGGVAMPTELPAHLLTSSAPAGSSLHSLPASTTPTKAYTSPIPSPLGSPSAYTPQGVSSGMSLLPAVPPSISTAATCNTSSVPNTYINTQIPYPSTKATNIPISDVTDGRQEEMLGPIYPHPDEARTSSGLLGWISSHTFINKVMEKTKSSVETMITTLDPGMKEVIHRGGNINIIVTSSKDVKVVPVRQAFQEMFGRATVDGVTSQPNIAPQPVGYAAAMKGAEERISNLRISESITERQAAVSIENFIVELLPNKWFDIPCLLLLDPVYDLRIEVFGQAIPIPPEYVMQAQDDTPEDYTLRWSGLAVTIGQVIQHNLPHVDHTDWHQAFTGVSRRNIIYTAAQVLAGMYKRQLPPEAQTVME